MGERKSEEGSIEDVMMGLLTKPGEKRRSKRSTSQLLSDNFKTEEFESQRRMTSKGGGTKGIRRGGKKARGWVEKTGNKRRLKGAKSFEIEKTQEGGKGGGTRGLGQQPQRQTGKGKGGRQSTPIQKGTIAFLIRKQVGGKN